MIDVHLSILDSISKEITDNLRAVFREACGLCLDSNGHNNPIEFEVSGKINENILLGWDSSSNPVQKSYDIEERVEFGAIAIALIIIEKFTNLTVLEKAHKGTGFDFWLGDRDSEYFQNKTKLEVSGILKGKQSLIDSRMNIKLKQIDKSNMQLPAYVIIVEFGTPKSYVKTKNI